MPATGNAPEPRPIPPHAEPPHGALPPVDWWRFPPTRSTPSAPMPRMRMRVRGFALPRHAPVKTAHYPRSGPCIGAAARALRRGGQPASAHLLAWTSHACAARDAGLPSRRSRDRGSRLFPHGAVLSPDLPRDMPGIGHGGPRGAMSSRGSRSRALPAAARAPRAATLPRRREAR
jgi:hypothetical protein